jgi:hypothetical protein
MLPVDLNAEECLDVMERALPYGRWYRRRPGACEPVPKRLISHYRMNAAALAHVEQVLTQRHAALCSPSDMVVVAAQSIAEPSTQMVLNSVTWDTELLISIDGVLTKTTIGGVHGRAWRARRARPTWRRTHRIRTGMDQGP